MLPWIKARASRWWPVRCHGAFLWSLTCSATHPCRHAHTFSRHCPRCKHTLDAFGRHESLLVAELEHKVYIFNIRCQQSHHPRHTIASVFKPRIFRMLSVRRRDVYIDACANLRPGCRWCHRSLSTPAIGIGDPHNCVHSASTTQQQVHLYVHVQIHTLWRALLVLLLRASADWMPVS